MRCPGRLVSCAVLAALVHAVPAAAEEQPSLETRLAEKAPAIVTVKVVLKSEDEEATREVRGAVVDPSGLVMTSSSELSGDQTPARLHVMFGTDPKENPAVLVARDGNLRLSFVQVLDVSGLPAIDLSKGSTPKIGQDLLEVTRSGRGFDFAPAIHRFYVTGRLEKPRPLWDFAGDVSDRGLPVFDLAGAPVGVIVDQESAAGVEAEGVETEVFILPLEPVLKSLDAAKKRVPEAVARAKKEDAETKEESAPEAPAAPDAPKAPEEPRK